MCNDVGSREQPADAAHARQQAERLAMLAREARLLEFALQGDGSAARRVAAELERALERAMDADTPAELQQSCEAIQSVLDGAFRQGMRLFAQMTDMDIEGALGVARMPVLTTVLSVGEAEQPAPVAAADSAAPARA